MPTLEKYKEKLHKDVKSFSEELQEKFPDAVFTSGYRENAVTKFGKKSRHSNGEAIDLSINPEISNYLNSKDGVALLYKYQLGFLDESTPEGSKFGNSLHIGRDYALVERANDKYKNLFGERQETLTTNVNNLQVPPTAPTFVETETPKDKDVKELKQQTAEYNFMEELKTIPQRELVEQPQQQMAVEQLPQTNYLQQYEQVSNFIDNPIAQQGGQYAENELAFLSEIAIKDNQGQRKYPNQVTKIEGDTMATNGYGDIPLYVIPNRGVARVVEANTGEHTFPGATEFIEIPITKRKLAQQGGTVSEIWEKTTGTPWAEAKRQGLTDGSVNSNLSLRDKLLKGEFTTNSNIENTTSVNKQQPANFNEAFKIAREQLGANQIFEFEGRKYGTNLTGETFTPSEEVLVKNKMNLPAVKQRLVDQNEKVVSPYTNKNTVKLQPEYKDWEEKKKDKKDFNKMEQAEKIVSFKNKYDDGKNYAVVDKKKGLVHIYKPGNSTPIFSSPIDLGENKGDAQTVTKLIDPSKPETSKADFSKGNKTTGAGKYYISNIDQKGYGGLPILNMMNETQYEKFKKTGKIENVATSFHKGYISDDETRVSNGCIRCNKTTLDNLSKHLQNTSEVYILPEDKGNEFVYENGKLNFKASSGKDYDNYTDSNKEKQKGQGINRTINTLNYKPIKIQIETQKLKDFGDKEFSGGFEKEQYDKTIKPFISSIVNNKKKVMQIAKINGDTYNDIAKVAFGIFGTESNFGDEHSGFGNFFRGVKKAINSDSSSPDYKSKYNTYGANEDYRSAGLTQIRWSFLNEDEKTALKEVGIKSNKDFLEPEKAALGTLLVLGIRYNQQLNKTEKKDILNNLPKVWNKRENYTKRVNDNSKYISIKELE